MGGGNQTVSRRGCSGTHPDDGAIIRTDEVGNGEGGDRPRPGSEVEIVHTVSVAASDNASDCC